MNLNPQQKLEDILKKVNDLGELSTGDLLFPQFPDNKQMNGKIVFNFNEIIRKLLPVEKANTFVNRVNKCMYSVTDPSSKIQKNEYNKCMKEYNTIINTIHDDLISK